MSLSEKDGETDEEDDLRDGEKPEGRDDRDDDDDDEDDDYEEFFGGEDPDGEGKNDGGFNWPFGFFFGN